MKVRGPLTVLSGVLFLWKKPQKIARQVKNSLCDTAARCRCINWSNMVKKIQVVFFPGFSSALLQNKMVVIIHFSRNLILKKCSFCHSWSYLLHFSTIVLMVTQDKYPITQILVLQSPFRMFCVLYLCQ